MYGNFRVIEGDALAALAALPSESVHLVVTSPPYWALRDYGTGAWTGGDPGCEHRRTQARRDAGRPSGNGSRFRGAGPILYGLECSHCGAVRVDHQIGLEALHDCLGWAGHRRRFCDRCYLCRMRRTFAEVRRVLRDDGTCWINIGDTSATGAGKAESPGGGRQGERFRIYGPGRGEHNTGKHAYLAPNLPPCQPNRMPVAGLKPKDLTLIPDRLALALQADGWWVRRKIVWEKTNPMPESVTDRPTQAHEDILMLAKSENYFYDRLNALEESTARPRRNLPSAAAMPADPRKRPSFAAGSHSSTLAFGFRNRRTVWRVGTMPIEADHYATFPIEIPELCILLGTSERGVCPDCGAPWERVIRKRPSAGNAHLRPELYGRGINRAYYPKHTDPTTKAGKVIRSTAAARAADPRAPHDNPFPTPETAGWRPGCACYVGLYLNTCPPARSARKRLQRLESGDWRRRVALCRGPLRAPAPPLAAATVLDPFAGLATTGLACLKTGRRFLGVELKPEWVAESYRRARRHYPLLLEVADEAEKNR